MMNDEWGGRPKKVCFSYFEKLKIFQNKKNKPYTPLSQRVLLEFGFYACFC
jgi:hypothetical protein